MSRWLFLCLAGLLLLGGWWFLADETEGEQGVELRNGSEEQGFLAEQAHANRNPELGSQEAVERIASAPVAPAQEAIGWRGRLTWTDGTAAGGLVIRARHPDTELPLCHAVSDADGFYHLPLGQRFEGYREHEELDLSCDGYYSKSPDWPSAKPTSPFAVVDIVLERGTPLEIKAVHKATGTPAAGVWVNANCETDWWHEVRGLTDASGFLQVHLPHLGPWAFMGLEPGVAIAPESIFWLKPGDQGVTLELLPLPQALHLVAKDMVSGAPIPHASFHGARVPEDVRQVPDQAYVELPTTLDSENGSLHMLLEEAGRVFVRVKADGYFPEVAEVVLASDSTFEVPMIPLEEVRVGVTRQGEPVAAKVSIGFNRHTLLYPPGLVTEDLALQPQCAPLLRYELEAKRENAVALPELAAPTSPSSFDLWVEADGVTKYFGVIHRDTLPPQPWIFELEPKQGSVVVQVHDAAGTPLVGVNVQLSHQIDEGFRDAAALSTNGLSSRIYPTDAKGQVRAKFSTPCLVTASVSQLWNDRKVEGRLEDDGELHLDIQMEKPYDPNEEEALPTSGRVQFEGAMPEGLTYDALSISIVPDLFFGEYIIFLNEKGEWSSSMPAGFYSATLEDDTSSHLKGHSIRFEAGTQNNILRLPSPRGLLLNIRELGSGQTLMADDVDLWVDGKWLTWMEAYADGSAGSQMIFADRVEYDVEKNGYVPAFGVVDLQRGVITQHEVVLHPARTLTLQYAQEPEGEETYLQWLNPPQRSHAFTVHVFHRVWDKAPTDACRLQAVDEDRNPIGPVFTVESGLADLTVQVPFFDS